MSNIINEAEHGIQKITELKITLESIENELQRDPKFLEFLRVQDELKSRRASFDAQMKELMIERFDKTGEKKLSVGNAEFSLTPREELVIEDIDKLDPKFVETVTSHKLNKEAVKAVQVLEGELVEGVGVKRSYAYKLKFNDEETK